MPRKPGNAFVDTALPANELIQWLRIRLVRRGVTHHSAPLAPRPFVGLGRVGGGPNDGGERVFPIRYFQPPKAQRPTRSVSLATLCGPPLHQTVHGAQVPIDCITFSAGLAVVP